MSFADNLRLTRKDKNITQEELAELLNVSRQAISKWESGNGYPETDKLILISEKLDISLDYLLLDEKSLQSRNKDNRQNIIVPSGKVYIKSYDDMEVVNCQAVKYSTIFAAKDNEPKYILSGIYGINFWGERSTILGWYDKKEDVNNEIKEISESIEKGKLSYKLKYSSEIEFVGFFQQPKLKTSNSK